MPTSNGVLQTGQNTQHGDKLRVSSKTFELFFELILKIFSSDELETENNMSKTGN